MAHDHKITKPFPDSKEFARALAQRECREAPSRHVAYADSYALGCMTIHFATLVDRLEAVLAKKPGASRDARRVLESLRETASQSEGDPTGAGTPAESGDQVHEQRNESPEGTQSEQ